MITAEGPENSLDQIEAFIPPNDKSCYTSTVAEISSSDFNPKFVVTM